MMKKAFCVAGGIIFVCLLVTPIAAYFLPNPIVLTSLSSGTQLRFLPLVQWGFYSQNGPLEPPPLARSGLLPFDAMVSAPYDWKDMHISTVYGCFDVNQVIVEPEPLPFVPVPNPSKSPKQKS